MNEEQESEKQLPTIEEKKERNYKFLKTMSTIFSVVIIIILIIIKNNNDSFKTLPFVLILGGISILWAFFFWGIGWFESITNKLKKADEKDKLPPIKSELEVLNLAKSIIESDEYQNHIRRWVGKSNHKVKDNLIYIFKGELVYELENEEGSKQGRDFYFLANAHTPKQRWSLLPANECPTSKLIKEANKLSTEDPDKPEVEEMETYNPMNNTFMKTRKTTPYKKKKDSKKEGGLG